MTIQQYIIKINTLGSKENEDSHLENLVAEISLNEDKIQFQFSNLLQNSLESGEIIINYEIINKIENSLRLIFIKEEEPEANVCFANSNEVRSEYRQSFRFIDLLDYVFAFVHSSKYRELSNILITSESDLFWSLVEIGINYRKQEIK